MTAADYPSAREHGHTYGEAFMLMRYRCQGCRYTEVIYNARDAVTPYTIACPRCSGTDHRHIDWHRDVFDPDHVPAVGDRVFLDTSRETLVEAARARVERWWDDAVYAMRDHPLLGPLGKVKAAEHLADEEWKQHDGHVPSVVTVDETLHRALTAEKLNRREEEGP